MILQCQNHSSRETVCAEETSFCNFNFAYFYNVEYVEFLRISPFFYIYLLVCVCLFMCVCVCVHFQFTRLSIRVEIFSNFYSYLRIIFFHRILFCKFFYYKNNRLEVFLNKSTEELSHSSATQKMKFSINDFFSKCDQIRRFPKDIA